jgi:hypothetical protein
MRIARFTVTAAVAAMLVAVVLVGSTSAAWANGIPKVTLKASPKVAGIGDQETLSGTVKHSYPRCRTVIIQQWVGIWRQTTKARLTAKGTFSVHVNIPESARQFWNLRAVYRVPRHSYYGFARVTVRNYALLSVGQTATVWDDQGDKAQVTLSSVSDYTQPASTYGEAPANGEYAVCDVSVTVTTGSYDVNSLNFLYQAPGGLTYDCFDGNASSAGFDPELQAVTLQAGQQTRGYVTFDVPAGTTGADVQLTWGGDVVAQWNR